MSEAQTAVYSAHRTAQDKYTYFLLTAAGASVAFAATQVKDLTLAMSQIPLSIAVLSWALSFFFGCQNLQYVTMTLYDNAELLEVRNGTHPLAGRNPEAMQMGISIIRRSLNKNQKRIVTYARWQFWMLIAGAFFYIGWQTFEMYLRIKPVHT